MTETIDDKIQRIKQKIAKQGLTLHPCLTDEEVQQFEQQQAITIPAGYRQFLLEIGDGGEGPPDHSGQIFRLRETIEQSVWAYKDVEQPFPFSASWNTEEDKSDEDIIVAKIDAQFHGGLTIGYDGWGNHWRLIVTGNEHGNMWLMSEIDPGVIPAESPRDFLSWYERWLDEEALQ